MKKRRLLLMACLFWLGVAGAAARAGEVFVITVADPVSPGTAYHIQNSIRRAEAAEAECLVIMLDTPGGLVQAMREIVMAILGSRVPVVVYVAPGGARAASAGVMITMAAHVAAMAPGTNIGAAHPVGAGGQEMDEAMTAKVVNDMVAHARSVAEKRGRNPDWVEQAIRESVSITETEALERNVIELVAEDLEALIEKLDGREIEGMGVLNVQGAPVRVLEESLRTRILKAISDPNIAYILLMLGLAGLYFEFSNPGAILPGVVGGLSLILAFFAFQTLPIDYAGVLLIGLALVLFVLELKVTSYGLLSLAAMLSLFLGSIMLFETVPGIRLSPAVFWTTFLLFCGFFLVVTALVVRARQAPPRTGIDGLIGHTGVVREAVRPEGKVLIHGEIWRARSRVPIEAGARVRVLRVENLVLEVEPAETEGDMLP